MLREAGERRTIQALHVLVASGLFAFAFVTQWSDSIAAIVYLSFGIPGALLIAFGLSLGGSSGMKVRVVGCALVAYVAMSGWFAASPIAVPGGTLWWLLLLAVALVGAVSPSRTAQSVVDGRTIRGIPRLGEAVVGAQAVLALCVIGVLMIALSNAHGISGIGLPILLVPFTAVVVAGIAYRRGVRWPVVLSNVPLFLFAFLAAREELASSLLEDGLLSDEFWGVEFWSFEGPRLLPLVAIALLTGFSVIAALLPPQPVGSAAI